MARYDLQLFAADGKLNFDVDINSSGFSSGVGQLGGIFKQGLGVMVGNMMTSALRNVTALGKEAINVGASFETATSQIAATMGKPKAEIQEIINEAKRLGAETAFSASEAAEGFNILAQSGLSASEQIAAMPNVLNLAAAGALSLESAASYVTGAVKGFNDEMANSQYYADLIAKGASLANTSVDAFGLAMSDAAASMNSYGQSADETALALLRLAEQNVTGSEAATALNRAMMDLYTPTSSAKKKLDELGVSAYDLATGAARPLSDVVDDLALAMADMDDETKNATKNIIFSTFGLQAFNKMTVSSAEKVEQLRQGIAEAGGAAEEMAGTQLDNLEGKLTIMGSAAEALGIAIYEVFAGDMSRAVEAGTDAITRLQQSITDGALGESLARLSASLGDFLESAISLAEKALPVLIDGLTWLVDHMDIIAAGVGAVVVATTAYNAVTAISATVTQGLGAVRIALGVATGALTTAEANATAAQLGLNAAMLANPAGLLAAAVAGLVAGLIIFVQTNKDATKGLSEAGKAAKEQADALRDLNEQTRSSAQTRAEAVAELGKESDHARKLIGDLKALQGSDQNLNQTLGRQKEIIAQLNQTIPGLSLAINEQTGELNMSAETLDKNVESWEKLIEAQLAQEQANEIIEQKNALEKELAETEERLNAISEEAAEARERYNKNLQEASDSTAWLLEADAEIISKEAELRAQYDETKASLDALSTEYDATQDVIADTSAYEAAEEGMSGMAEATKELTEAQQEMIDSFQKSVESFDAMFDQMATEAEQSLAQISENLQHNTSAMTNYGENIVKAQQLVAQDSSYQAVIDHFMSMGVDGAAYLDQLVNAAENDSAAFQQIMSDWGAYLESVDFVEQAQAAYVSGSESAMAAAVESLEAAKQEAVTKAGEMTTEAAGAIADGSGEVTEAAGQVLDDTVQAVEDELPRVVEAGTEITNKLSSGMDGGRGTVVAKARQIASDIRSEFLKVQWSQVGLQICQGIAQGISSGSSIIAQAAANAAQQALTSAKSSLAINSPSRRFREEVGQQIPPAIKLGIDDKIDDVDFAPYSDRMIDNARAAIEYSTSEASGIPAMSAIDYDAFGEKIAEALDGVAVNMDGKPVGRITSTTVNEAMATQSVLERRGVL